MPKLADFTTTRLNLPSTESSSDPAWVEVRSKLTLGDMAELYKLDDKVEQVICILSKIITDWNFTEDGTPDGAKAEISAENVRKFDAQDFMYLGQWINENIDAQSEGLSNPEKKASSATLPVAEESASQTSQQISVATEI